MKRISLLVMIAAAACSGGTDAPKAEPASPTGPTATGVTIALRAPEDVAFDEAGVLYVSEFEGNRVIRLEDGIATTEAGTGDPGSAGDGGPAVDALLAAPTGLAFDAAGELAIADLANDQIRLVGTDGAIAVIAGGPGSHGALDEPIGVAFATDGALYIADEKHGVVQRLDPDGTLETIAGGGDHAVPQVRDGDPATSVDMGNPSYVVLDDGGNLYVSDFSANVVWRIDPAGMVTRFAGTGDAGSSGDGGPATEATFSFPTGLALDDEGTLYVSDAENHRVRMIGLDGTIQTVAGTGEPGKAGLGGPATEAQLDAPAGLEIGPDGLLYIADQGNDRVVRVTESGALELVL